MPIAGNASASRRGYLNNDFEFFHLKDNKGMEFESHYHDFNKIIILISGKVTYCIEGKAYKLKPWDILLVSSSELHKVVIDSGAVYERIIIWLNPAFIEKHNTSDCNLHSCFKIASSRNHNVLRLNHEQLGSMINLLAQLEEECKSKEFGSRILKNSLFCQFMVRLNRLFLSSEANVDVKDVEYDERIGSIIKYINDNINENLSIDNLASRFFMSKYYLMHKFKAHTGYSIHSYITQKRLMMAGSLIKKGLPVYDVCIETGFGDYTSFLRAFKKMYGLSPKQYYKDMQHFWKSYNTGSHLQ